MTRRKKINRPSNKSSDKFKIKYVESDYNSRKPIFSLRHMTYQGDCCITNCEQTTKGRILDKILRLSQSTWSQIQSHKKKSGFEKIPHYRFKVALPPILTPEVPILVARYDQSGRFAGFRDKDIFHIVLVGDDLYSH